MIRRGLDTAEGQAGYCGHCDRSMPDGPDMCLGTLDNVAEACCGHGWVTQPYVLFADRKRLQGREAIHWFDDVGIGPPPVETVTVRLFEQYDGQLFVTAEYDYETLRLISLRWANNTEKEPVWNFDGVSARLTQGTGLVPLTVASRITSVELVADGG